LNKNASGKPAAVQFLEFTPAMRTLIEDAIEALMLSRDEIDGDAYFEPIGERKRERWIWTDLEPSQTSYVLMSIRPFTLTGRGQQRRPPRMRWRAFLF
jgi:hypothetical protein